MIKTVKESYVVKGNCVVVTNMTKYMVIGNQGAGKSSILNAIAGRDVFKTKSVNYKFDHEEHYENYVDAYTIEKTTTKERDKVFIRAGQLFNDDTLELRSNAINSGLDEGGDYKLIFLLSYHATNTVWSEQIFTLYSVLKDNPKIGNRYGIVINKIPKECYNDDLRTVIEDKIFSDTMYQIESQNRCSYVNFFHIARCDELENSNPKATNIRNITNITFDNWLDRVPTLHIEYPTSQTTSQNSKSSKLFKLIMLIVAIVLIVVLYAIFVGKIWVRFLDDEAMKRHNDAKREKLDDEANNDAKREGGETYKIIEF